MFKQDAVKLGIAPIGWTNDDLPELGSENTFEQCISEMALAGFSGTEVGTKYPRDADKLKKALALRNIEIASAWFSAFLTTQPLEQVKQEFILHRNFLAEMGAKVIVVSEQGHSIQKEDLPLFENKPVFTDDDWTKLVSGLHELGRLAKEKGMDIVFHHHMGTGVQTTEEINRLMEQTDPELISLLYDTGHLYLSGEDPVEVLKHHLPRIKHVHLKDVRSDIAKKTREEHLCFLAAVKLGVFTVPGDGAFDFTPVFQVLANSDYKGWMLVEAEQDPAKANPFEYAKMARTYIAEKAGV
ncbi:inosose dehydratase [Bacillus sp. J14TS2]|uniref:myo-inosose-2 dehydratase n=1 Tax=Bacillus sp. J14TS2 TaxID=2807188 RepID=UPI001B2C956B|nr:myo-inosose-2 dehydratase [Bacillus sp. J14TS2]GIN71558.1 inosose dehydratase [Bacillus sp. J14TS2]